MPPDVRLDPTWYQALVACATDYAIIAMDLGGRIHDWSPGAQRLFQFGSSEVIGQSGDVIFTPEDRRERVPDRERESCLRSGAATDERWHVRQDGSRFWASGRLILVRRLNGEAWGFAKIVQDRTAEKAMYDRLQQAEEHNRVAQDRIARHNAELEASVAQRTRELTAALKDLEEFSYSMSHDLKGPANTMRALLEILRQEETSPEEQRDIFERSYRNSVVLCDLITEMLRFTEIGLTTPRFEAIDLDDLMHQLIAEAKDQRPDRSLIFEVAPPLGTVRADRILLAHAVRNLLSNATKFVAPGVTPRVAISSEPVGRALRLHVRDNGIGIDPRFRDQIFELFRRLHHSRAYPGHGVGLATVKRAVEKLAGTVRFQSVLHEGTVFTLELPRAD